MEQYEIEAGTEQGDFQNLQTEEQEEMVDLAALSRYAADGGRHSD